MDPSFRRQRHFVLSIVGGGVEGQGLAAAAPHMAVDPLRIACVEELHEDCVILPRLDGVVPLVRKLHLQDITNRLLAIRRLDVLRLSPNPRGVGDEVRHHTNDIVVGCHCFLLR